MQNNTFSYEKVEQDFDEIQVCDVPYTLQERYTTFFLHSLTLNQSKLLLF